MAKSSRKRNTILICLGLIIAVLVAFEPIRHNDFLGYDDNDYRTENHQIKAGITWQSVKWAFTTSDAANWHPLTWLSHMVDYQLFGLNPLGHHLVNLLFHIINTLLLFLVFKSMTKVIWPSALVAAVFALHPLHVESVVWAAERKDVLSTFFWLLTMAAYVRYCRIPSVGKYLIVVLFFTLGLMAKPMLVTLPFVLLLLDRWPLGRFQWAHRKSRKDLPLSQSYSEDFGKVSGARLLMEKIPLLILVVASCVVTYLAQQQGGAVTSAELLPVKYRVGNALVSYVGYINKMVYPHDLAVIYPLAAKLISVPQLIFSLLELTAISAIVLYFSRRRGYLTMGWLWYLGTLVPVIGLVQVGSAAMADRYTYVPLIGVFIMVAWGGAEILAKWRFRKNVVAILVSIMLIAMVASTRKQVKYWKNSLSLFEHTIAVTQNNYLAYGNLGIEYGKLGQYPKAIDLFKHAVELNSSLADTHFNLGFAYSKVGQYHKAIELCGKAVDIKPDYAEAHLMLGVNNFKLGRYQEAIVSYQKAILVKQDFAKAHYNLAVVYGYQGRHLKAIVSFKEAIRFKPDYVNVYQNLGVAYHQLERYQDEIDAYKQVVRIKPEDAKAHYNLGVVYLTIGDKVSANKEYEILKRWDRKRAKKLLGLINAKE